MINWKSSKKKNRNERTLCMITFLIYAIVYYPIMKKRRVSVLNTNLVIYFLIIITIIIFFDVDRTQNF